MSNHDRPRRIAVIGTSGSGKTTFARSVAAAVAAPHIELDAIFHQPNWVPAERDVFHALGFGYPTAGSRFHRVAELQPRNRAK